MSRVLLVACGDAKLDRPAPARDLYVGSLTRAAIRYADASGHLWFIVSAKHGLVRPEQVLDPYDLSIADLERHYRRVWARQVAVNVPVCDEVEVHMGANYLQVLQPWLPCKVVDPLAGLGLGKRLQWYAGQRA